MRLRIAISCARKIFWMVSGHHAPALTVASLATIDGRAPFDAANPGDYSGSGRLSIVLVVSQQEPDFEEHRFDIEQGGDPLPRRQLTVPMLFVDLRRTASRPESLLQFVQLLNGLTGVVSRSVDGHLPRILPGGGNHFDGEGGIQRRQ